VLKYLDSPGDENSHQALLPLQETLSLENGSDEVLESADIRAIRAGPSVMHFGTVATCTENVQSFYVTNTLQRPIHVLVDAKSHDHLLGSTNLSQVDKKHPFTLLPTLTSLLQQLPQSSLFAGDSSGAVSSFLNLPSQHICEIVQAPCGFHH
jgi:hypothetical protein